MNIPFPWCSFILWCYVQHQLLIYLLLKYGRHIKHMCLIECYVSLVYSDIGLSMILSDLTYHAGWACEHFATVKTQTYNNTTDKAYDTFILHSSHRLNIYFRMSKCHQNTTNAHSLYYCVHLLPGCRQTHTSSRLHCYITETTCVLWLHCYITVPLVYYDFIAT